MLYAPKDGIQQDESSAPPPPRTIRLNNPMELQAWQASMGPDDADTEEEDNESPELIRLIPENESKMAIENDKKV